jgi:transposase-like protein
MSRQRKRDAVLRLLRGEDLEMVSRSLGVTAATLTTWRDSFLAAGEASLAARPTDGETLESERLKARLGDMLLKHELLEQKITSLEGGRPLAWVRGRWADGRKFAGFSVACDERIRGVCLSCGGGWLRFLDREDLLRR